MGSIVIVAFSPNIFAAPVRNPCAGVKIGNRVARGVAALPMGSA
jgi:hypothetical protein